MALGILNIPADLAGKEHLFHFFPTKLNLTDPRGSRTAIFGTITTMLINLEPQPAAIYIAHGKCSKACFYSNANCQD